MKNPDKINLDKSQADALVARLESNSLTDFDRTIPLADDFAQFGT